MRICCAISGFSSILSLTIRTAPLAARTVFSRIGPSCLHGPHHGAQKSTMTGCSNEASTTSVIKLWVVTSLTTAAVAAPPPIRVSSAMHCSPGTPAHKMAAAGRQNKHRQPASAGRGGGCGAVLRRVEIDEARPVPAGGDKAQEIGRRNRGGAVVFERVVVEGLVLQHRPIEDDRDPPVGIVDEGERGHAAGPDAERLVEQFGAAEREARRAQRRG